MPQPPAATPALVAASPRIEWSAVPARVRDAVEASLGSPVVEAVTQLGGFSPGAAVRVVLADGSHAFVKAVGAELNPDSPVIYRAEIRALEGLPDHLPAGRLRSSYDDGGWVALVLDDVAGRRPDLPWQPDDVAATAASLQAIGATTAPASWPTFADTVNVLDGWDYVRADPSGFAPALVDRLPEMADAQALAREVTRGDAVVHWDARADNILIEPSGRAVLLDWAWACRGAPWLDTLLFAADFAIQGGPDPDEFLRANPVTRDVPPEHLRAVIACMVGVWHEWARRPAPPGLPTIRAWQAHCGTVALRWLDEGALWR